jgi:hypothetical protein
MAGERQARWTWLVLAALFLAQAAAQRDVVTGPGSYPSGVVRVPMRLESVPPDAVHAGTLRVPLTGEVGAIYEETTYLVTLNADGSRGATITPACGTDTVLLRPGRYEVVTDSCSHSWQWLHHEDRYGHSALTGRPIGAVVKVHSPMTCVHRTYVIEVFDDDALKESCPSWHASDVAPGLAGYRASLSDRHNVVSGIAGAEQTLRWCEEHAVSRHHIVCRAARARIAYAGEAVDAYVDDCERMVAILERPGAWQRLQDCFAGLGLPTAAANLEDGCASPEDVCARLHQHVMSLIGRASDSAQAYRNLPACLRFLYPSSRVLEDWYTGGRPLDF